MIKILLKTLFIHSPVIEGKVSKHKKRVNEWEEEKFVVEGKTII